MHARDLLDKHCSNHSDLYESHFAVYERGLSCQSRPLFCLFGAARLRSHKKIPQVCPISRFNLVEQKFPCMPNTVWTNASPRRAILKWSLFCKMAPTLARIRATFRFKARARQNIFSGDFCTLWDRCQSMHSAHINSTRGILAAKIMFIFCNHCSKEQMRLHTYCATISVNFHCTGKSISNLAWKGEWQICMIEWVLCHF